MTIEFDGVYNIIKPSNDAMQIGVSGDTITIPSGATITNSGTANGFGADQMELRLLTSQETLLILELSQIIKLICSLLMGVMIKLL